MIQNQQAWLVYYPIGDVAYYNFDNDVPLLAYSLKNKLNFVSRGDEKSHIQRRKLIALQRRRKQDEERMKMEKEMLVEEELELAVMINIKPATMLKLK